MEVAEWQSGIVAESERRTAGMEVAECQSGIVAGSERRTAGGGRDVRAPRITATATAGG